MRVDMPPGAPVHREREPGVPDRRGVRRAGVVDRRRTGVDAQRPVRRGRHDGPGPAARRHAADAAHAAGRPLQAGRALRRARYPDLRARRRSRRRPPRAAASPRGRGLRGGAGAACARPRARRLSPTAPSHRAACSRARAACVPVRYRSARSRPALRPWRDGPCATARASRAGTTWTSSGWPPRVRRPRRRAATAAGNDGPGAPRRARRTGRGRGRRGILRGPAAATRPAPGARRGIGGRPRDRPRRNAGRWTEAHARRLVLRVPNRVGWPGQSGRAEAQGDTRRPQNAVPCRRAARRRLHARHRSRNGRAGHLRRPARTPVRPLRRQGETRVTTVSDAQGVFRFADLAEGVWAIRVDMIGFAPLTRDVTIPPNGEAPPWEMALLSFDEIAKALPPAVLADAAARAAGAPSATSGGASPAGASGTPGSSMRPPPGRANSRGSAQPPAQSGGFQRADVAATAPPSRPT